MVAQSQPDQASQSQTLLADASLRFCPRRKLSYSNGKKSAAVVPETDLSSGAGNEKNDGDKKRTRKAGSPLLEMPDLSQKTCSQASPCSSERLSAHPDSPQSSDSTQIDDCLLRKSPVFPSTGSRAEVHVSRLTQDLLDTCRNSGFVLCSQDSWASTQTPAKPGSPTFPDGNLRSFPEADQSPVFGRNTQRETPPSACKPQASVCSPTCENSGFTLSSQDSLTSPMRPKSPVFNRSERPPSKPNRGATEQRQGRSGSPAFGRTGRPQEGLGDVQDKSGIPSVGSSREDGNVDGGRVDGFDAASDGPDDKPGDWKCSETELTSDMRLVWSDEDEEDDDDVTQAGGSPSPVFPEERPPHRAESQTASLNHLDDPETNCSLNPQRCNRSSSNKTLRPASSSSSSSCASRGTVSGTAPPSGEPAGGQTVHYYWGVPFCPRGLDPDSYTKVILAQMEVYEKSLKQAQRCLLRKAEWGEAVLPQPEKSPSPELLPESPQHHAPQRRGLRLRGLKPSEAAEGPPAEAEEEERREKETAEEEKNGGDEGPVDIDDCEVCPETQLSDATQDLMDDAGAEVSPRPPPRSSDSPEVQMILQEGSPTGEEPPPPQEEEEEMEVDAPTDEKAEPSIDSAGQTARNEEVTEDRMDPDVEEVVTGSRLPRSESPELELAVVVARSPETAVDCPICQASFPASQIEMHAAYCDGEAVDRRRPGGSQASLKPRRKRTRRAEATLDETDEASSSGRNQERCYICQKNIPLRDYSRHTELCIQRRTSKTAAKGNLLSALEQTESRDSGAGPSGSKLPAGDVIDLRDDDDDEEEEEVVSAFRISNSPIRSFTSISEATDCLIDFKKQRRAAKPSQRRR